MNPAHKSAPDTRYWHCLSAKAVCAELRVDPKAGLDSAEITTRLQAYGPNRIEEARRQTPLRMLLNQFTDFMILVLIVAAVVSGFIGEAIDAIAIIVIVVLNAVFGFVQEYRAERALEALQQMAAPGARVLRGGSVVSISASELVPGDVVLLEAGNVVPADIRVIETFELWADEAPLTGESVPVAKSRHALGEEEWELPLGDRTNMAYKGTRVTKGRATGIVVATGMGTELGRIAALLGKESILKTPLQLRLTAFGRRLAIAILGICVVVFLAGLARGEEPLLMFLTAVSLAVAAIPEALPAVVTIALALGARRMVQHKALARRLPAVETLGSVSFICSDKTGTLTQNIMHAEQYHADGQTQASIPRPEFTPWRELATALALNNDAAPDEADQITGDPTEVALYIAALRAGCDKALLEQTMPRVAELPFDAERKCMTTFHRRDGGVIAYTKGAPETVLPLCTHTLTADGTREIQRDTLLAEAEALAGRGYRLLAIAQREWEAVPDHPRPDAVERDLVFIGLVALVDPPRPEAEESIRLCRSAGITPVMITGDHPSTARAIATRLGIIEHHERVITGTELAQLAPEEFAVAAEQTAVYARVTPEQKIDIVRALQADGEFVAMTGDGVNDAPALQRADIGVAMGKKGTDVAREAADMVLLDDNFATIVAAVREGRRIYDNIRKFIKDTMTSNSGEIWTLLLAPFFGLPLPLLPIQILWINLVTDGLPGLALAVEQQERGIMQRPPRAPGESVFAHGMWQHMIWVGLLVGGLSLFSQAWAYHGGSEHWQTVVFTVLTLSQLVHSLAIRSERESLFSIGILSNRPLIGAVLLNLGLQLLVIYWDPLHPIFKTSDLPPKELALCLTLPWVVLVAVEIEKWLMRRGLIYAPEKVSGPASD